MSHRLQFAETKESTGPFKGVDRAEDTAESFLGMRILLEGHQIAVEAVEVFVVFDKELFDDFIHEVVVR